MKRTLALLTVCLALFASCQPATTPAPATATVTTSQAKTAHGFVLSAVDSADFLYDDYTLSGTETATLQNDGTTKITGIKNTANTIIVTAVSSTASPNYTLVSKTATLTACPFSYYSISLGKTINVTATGTLTITQGTPRTITGSLTLAGGTVSTIVSNFTSNTSTGVLGGTETCDGVVFQVTALK